MKKKHTFLVFLVFVICSPFLFNASFLEKANSHKQQKPKLTEQIFTINTSFSPNAKNSSKSEWLLQYELKTNTLNLPRNVSLQVQTIFSEDFFPIIHLNETKTVDVSFPTEKVANIVYNNLNDFYWLEIDGIDSQNIVFGEDSDITNTDPINYKTPQITLNESVDFNNRLYDLSWISNFSQNYAWILLPTVDLYSLDNLKTPLYHFNFNQETTISYEFPDYVLDIANWCWINPATLDYYFLDTDKTFQKASIKTNSISISSIPPEFNPPSINLNTAFYRKTQDITFIIEVNDPQERLLSTSSPLLDIVVATCYRNLINSYGEIVNSVNLTKDDFTMLKPNFYQATIKTYNLSSLEPDLIWIEDSIENLYWHSGILDTNETNYIEKFNNINGISKIKGEQYADEKSLNLTFDTAINVDEKQLSFNLEGTEFPYLLDYKFNLTVYDFKGKLATYHFDPNHNNYIISLEFLNKPLFPHTNINDYFYLELDSNTTNFYQYNDEFGFIKSMNASLNQNINIKGDLTNIDSNSNLLNYEDYIGGKKYLILIFISSVMIAFFILIIIFAINKLRIIL